MVQDIVDAWVREKDVFEDWLNSLNEHELEYLGYSDIVVYLVDLVINPYYEYLGNIRVDGYDFNKMTIIDNGDYQGTLIFLIPEITYQPDVDQYIYTHNYYGFCSGCDALQHAQILKREDCIKGIMSIALHLIENFKKLGE